MRTLDQIQDEDRKRRDIDAVIRRDGVPLNIRCPHVSCDAQLWDRSPGSVNASNPPTVWADCDSAAECHRVLVPAWVAAEEREKWRNSLRFAMGMG